jgi:hypothetical protein
MASQKVFAICALSLPCATTQILTNLHLGKSIFIKKHVLNQRANYLLHLHRDNRVARINYEKVANFKIEKSRKALNFKKSWATPSSPGSI